MSALWTPGHAGASPGFVRQSPVPPSQVRPHRPLPVACAGPGGHGWTPAPPSSLAPGRPTPRGSGSTGQGLCILHEGPTYHQYTQPSSSSTPPSCSASRRRRQPPERPGHPLRQVETAALPSLSPLADTHSSGVLRSHDIRNSQKSTQHLDPRPRGIRYDRGGRDGVGTSTGALRRGHSSGRVRTARNSAARSGAARHNRDHASRDFSSRRRP